jgi:hypothetical protein
LDGRLLTEIIQTDRARELQFCPDGKRFLTTSEQGVSRLWDGQTGFAVSEPFEGEVVFSPDGQRILTSARAGTIWRLWEIPTFRGVPAWLPDLAHAATGVRLDAAGHLEPVPLQERKKFKESIEHLSDSGNVTRWAKWYFADRATRTLSAFSAMTVPEYANWCLTNWNLKETVRYAPTNAEAFWQLASSEQFDAHSALRRVGVTVEAVDRMSEQTARNILSVLDGDPLRQNVINQDVLG